MGYGWSCYRDWFMETVASAKLKANVVGVIGLVENMPDGDAMRPGDVSEIYVRSNY